MVRDGIYYAVGLTAAGFAVVYVANLWLALPLFLLAAFCAFFFRDPDRAIPDGPVAVSPADGKIVAVLPEGDKQTRISIFLNIFAVHANRAPIAGTIAAVKYQKGWFAGPSRERASPT